MEESYELDSDIASLFTEEQLVIMKLKVELGREDLRIWFWEIVCVLQIVIINLQIWLP